MKIRQVSTKREMRQFVEFPLLLYKDNPYFVPPLYTDEMAIFKKGYMYHDEAESVFFNAYDDSGKMVGRIQGILQRSANQKWGQKRVRFTRFDAIDDQEVANALFGAVETWAKEKGMQEVVGPLGFSDLEREGLLIEGFDQLSTFEEQYNYPYYQKLIENLGYVKEVDWVESKIYKPTVDSDRLKRLSARTLERYKLRFGKPKNTKELIEKYADGIFEMLDITYAHIYGTVPLNEKVKKELIKNFKLIVDPRFTDVIVDENDKVVCFSICFPSIAKAVQKSGGRLTPGCIYRILKAKRKPEILDLGLIGVSPEYKNKGVSTAMMAGLLDLFNKGIEHAETNLNLEDNVNILNQWKNFDTKQHKRRRCFIKKI